MTSNQEDTMYEIHNNLDRLKLRTKFDKQLKKMYTQDKHKWKDMCEKWEYAYKKVSNKN
tara:strand:- start:608 stop:784 length:177 start_codon:yes stop_codon:yes gene_type:complete